jgi:hypothetical protein
MQQSLVGSGQGALWDKDQDLLGRNALFQKVAKTADGQAGLSGPGRTGEKDCMVASERS